MPSTSVPSSCFILSASAACQRCFDNSATRSSDSRHSLGNFGLTLNVWCLKSNGMSSKVSFGFYLLVTG